METILALEGADYVLIAADVTAARSIVVMKRDSDKIRPLDDTKLFAAAGVPGDVTKFVEHVQQDVRLYTLRSGIPMSTAAVAHYTRNELARFLRRSPFQCNVLLAGVDTPPNGENPSLYSIDYLGTLARLPFAAEGYAQYFVLSTLDRYWKKNMTLEQGLDVVRKCLNEVQRRLVISQPHFCIKVVTKDGVRIIDQPAAPSEDQGANVTKPTTVDVDMAAKA